MADNNSESFKLDLDAKDALASVNELKDSILKLGDSKNLSGLIEGFVKFAPVVAGAGAALYALKASFDLALDGSKLQALEDQFKNLTEGFGINAEHLKESIQEAIGPTNDLSDSLLAAKKALVELGPELSQKIPQYFEIARKAAAAFGGDINERFEEISRAIASGSTRRLKEIGLNVDAEKAYKDYAKSIGVTVDALSQLGKQQAISNALVDQATTKYKTIKADTDNLVTAQRTFSATWKEFGDTVSIAFNKAFGPAFKAAFEYFQKALDSVSTSLKANFGDGAEAAAAKVIVLNNQIKYARDRQDELNKAYGEFAQKMPDWQGYQRQIEGYTNSIDILKAAEDDRRKASRSDGASVDSGPKAAAGSPIDKDKQLAQEAKFQKDLESLNKARIDAEMQTETDADAFNVLLGEKRLSIAGEFAAKEAQVKADAKKGGITGQQEIDELFELSEQKNAALDKFDRDREQASTQVYDNQVKAARTAGEGIKAAFAQAGHQAAADLNNFGKQGQVAFNAVNTGAKKFFVGLGEGSKSAGDLMKGFFFNALADIAEAHGEVMLAEGIGTYNPVMLAEGAALLVLSGALRSQASSSGASSSGGGLGGGGGGAASSAGGFPQDTNNKPSAPTPEKKSVTIQVQGNYFETEQTKTRLLEMMREATDATDFKYQQIGVS